MDKDNIISTIKWLGIGIIVLLLLKECKSVIKTAIDNNKPKESRTIYRYKDTIRPKGTIIIFKDRPVPYPVYLKDTTNVRPKPIDSLEMHRFFVYRDSTEDANIKLYNTIITQGKTLNSFKPSYKLKVPLIIKDSAHVIDSVPMLYPPVFQISPGISFGKNIVAPEIKVSYKRNEFAVGYNLINSTKLDGVIVRYNYTIFRK